MKNIYHKLDAQLQFDGLKVMRVCIIWLSLIYYE